MLGPLVAALAVAAALADPQAPTECNKVATEEACVQYADCGFCRDWDVPCREGSASGPLYEAAGCMNWVYGGIQAEKGPINGGSAQAWLKDDVRERWFPQATGAEEKENVQDVAEETALSAAKEVSEIQQVTTEIKEEARKDAYNQEEAFKRLDRERADLLKRRKHLNGKLKQCMTRSSKLEKAYVEALESLDQALLLQQNMREEIQSNRKKSERFSTIAQEADSDEQKEDALERSKLAQLQHHMSVVTLIDATRAVKERQALLHDAKKAIKMMVHECGPEFKQLPLLFSRLDMLETEFEARSAVKHAVDATWDRYHRLFGKGDDADAQEEG